MSKKDDTPKNSSYIIDEIEQQLEQAIARKREEVEKALEEKIRKEKEAAQKRIEELSKEGEEEKKTLINFKSLLAEFENSKKGLKIQIKEHIEKAIQYQSEIESLTGKTLEELKKVSELNQQLEELQQDTGEKVSALKKDLEERYGIVAEVPEGEEHEGTEINLEQELAKLKKIKELLNSSGHVEEVIQEVEPKEQEEEGEGGEEGEGEEAAKAAGESQPEEEKMEEEELEPVEPAGAPLPEEPEEKQEAEQEKTEEELPEEKKPETGTEEEASFQVAFEKLEQYRKGDTNENEAEVSYFENNNRIVLDGEYLVSTLNNCFEEAKKLYIKLSQTESPKDQFFIKQELVNFQEGLRALFLRIVKMSEKGSWSLSRFTRDVLNIQVLRVFLERLSMENWSNAEEFTLFAESVRELESAFRTKVQLREAYLRSLKEEVESF